MTDTKRILYLHGFASSPQSSKAQFFAQKLAAQGFAVEIPDLAEGRFEHLTVSGQLRAIERAQRGEPAILIGSSMGGYLAALQAARRQTVEKVVLLAPAFGFYDLWKTKLGADGLRKWRENGWISVYHYGEGKEVSLAYDLMEDAVQFEGYPEFSQPGLIFHGETDTVVPVSQSIRYTERRPNIQLLEMRSGHELTDVLDIMWPAVESFLLQDGLD